MRKLKYETPEIRVALTAADIKANDKIWDSIQGGGNVDGELMPEESEEQ